MKKIVLTLACSLLLLGCGSRQAQSPVTVGIPAGATRAEAVHRLAQIYATLLTNTPELLRAEFKTPSMTKPAQVELTFEDGKLARVVYIPQ